METIKIEIKKNKCFVDDKLYGNVWKNQDLFGNYLINLLFYINRDGSNKINIINNSIDVTNDFKKSVIERYSNIPNTNLRDKFYKYCNINV